MRVAAPDGSARARHRRRCTTKGVEQGEMGKISCLVEGIRASRCNAQCRRSASLWRRSRNSVSGDEWRRARSASRTWARWRWRRALWRAWREFGWVGRASLQTGRLFMRARPGSFLSNFQLIFQLTFKCSSCKIGKG
jgi:hypothetical protein